MRLGLTTTHDNPPNPPFAKGGWGDFSESDG